MDYLNDRHQQVVVRGQKSEAGIIKAGVPQGSVLGPLLFLIYINDITLTTDTKMKLFADDTSIYIEFDNPEHSSAVLNEDMKSIQQWADQWLVTFSPPKTKLLTCSYKVRNYPPISFNGTIIESVQNHKHLGLTLSSNLGWSAHINGILANVSSMSDVMKKLKYDLDRKSLETTYSSFIRPKLEYASQIWDNCTKQDSDKLESFQLDIARTVTGARKGTSHEFIYNETNWLPLAERRSLTKLKFLAKMVDNSCPDYLNTLLPDKVEAIRPMSRFAADFQLPKCRTETFNRSFLPSTLKMWNDLPLESRNTDYFNDKLKLKCNSRF